MTVNLKGRSLLTLMDLTPEEIRHLLDLSKRLKAERQEGVFGECMRGRNILLLFEQLSTRTRSAFEVAATQEGGNATFLDSRNSQFGGKESLEDSAKVFGRMYDAIAYRGERHAVVEGLARHAGVPVYNGLTEADHPTQTLADLMTIEEHVGKPLGEVKVAFCGDTRSNMTRAWMNAAAQMGMRFACYGPAELAPDPALVAPVQQVCAQNGGEITFSSDPAVLAGADVVYTDVWSQVGEGDDIPESVRLLTPFRVTSGTLASTGNPAAIFMHRLPAYHDFETEAAMGHHELGYDIREVSDEVFRGAQSVVFDEAENRMHTIKALLAATIGREAQRP
ncbi:MAG: ornithine carbamoyltransferase [Clostridiales Family XIII bacterium]|jgi:ornithine carbamoyltransferase|nr:ornithine carbamoyltransferase [Clostridiales Family XIII bacterium]